MGHTNSTTNYNLPQFLGSDKPAWLTDINQAFNAIDGAIKNAADTASGAASAASGASSAASDAGTAAANAQASATAAGNQAATNAGAITTLQSRCAALESAVNALNGYKHIVNSYTDSGWRIDEYSDNSVRMRFEGTVSFLASPTLVNGWYRSVTNVTIPVAVVQSTADCYGSGAASGRLFVPVLVNSSTTLECQLLGGASYSGGVSVTNATIIVEGYKA